MKKKKKCKKTKVTFNSPTLPPCAEFLGNSAPLIIDDLIVFNNQNRLYVFLETKPSSNSTLDYTLATNIQISFTNFIIALYMEAIIKNKLTYDANIKIHEDPKLNEFIHSAINSSLEFTSAISPALGLVISNSNAILSLVDYAQDISYVTYVVTYILHVFERNPALFYGSNNYVFDNLVNNFFASNNIIFPNLISIKNKPHEN